MKIGEIHKIADVESEDTWCHRNNTIQLLKLAVVPIDGVYLKANTRRELKNLTVTFMCVVLIENTGLYSFLWRMKYFIHKYPLKVKGDTIESVPSLTPDC